MSNLNKETIRTLADTFTAESEYNRVAAEVALAPELAGEVIYSSPLIGYSAADDPLYSGLKEPKAVGELFRLPGEWLDGARSVISFFFPFTEAVRSSNRAGGSPSALWMHGRIEGQQFLARFGAYMADALIGAGYGAMVPVLSPDFCIATTKDGKQYTSSWSERHAAFVGGLGTFSLSRGLITERGMAGRLVSVVTTLPLEATVRPYTDLYEYCIRCGACVRRCPATAISLERGKENLPCNAFLNGVRERYSPYYGCGKCQTAVPCEFKNPSAIRGKC